MSQQPTPIISHIPPPHSSTKLQSSVQSFMWSQITILISLTEASKNTPSFSPCFFPYISPRETLLNSPINWEQFRIHLTNQVDLRLPWKPQKILTNQSRISLLPSKTQSGSSVPHSLLNLPTLLKYTHLTSLKRNDPYGMPQGKSSDTQLHHLPFAENPTISDKHSHHIQNSMTTSTPLKLTISFIPHFLCSHHPKPSHPLRFYLLAPLPKPKAPGYDLLTSWILQQLPHKAALFLTYRCNFPLLWKFSTIILFPWTENV